jgi:hypothetical protein
VRRLDPRHAGPLLLVIVAVAAAVQGSRVPMRWGPVAVAYGAYVAEWQRAVATEGSWLTTWIGLHPPVFAWVFSAALKLGVPPSGWLLGAGAASVSAVATCTAAVFVGVGARGRPAALVVGALIALSPHRVAYGLEINNYPLLVGALGAQMLGFSWWARGRGRVPLIVLSALLPWVHLLGVAALGGQLLAVASVDRRRLRELGPVCVGVGVVLLPLIPGLLGALGEPVNEGTGPTGAIGAMLQQLPGRYGLAAAGWTTAALAAFGAQNAWRASDRLVPVSWAACALTGAVAVVLAQSSAQASEVQFQYWLVPLLPTLALAGYAVCGHERSQRVVLALAFVLVANGGALALDAADARWVRSRAAISHPLTASTLADWGPGDALLLIGVPWYGDDDKDAVDATWALVPRGIALDYTDPLIPGLTAPDPQWGQPVQFADGRWLYTFTAVDTGRLDTITDAHLGRGQRVSIAAYGLAREAGAAGKLKGWAGVRGAAARASDDEVALSISPADRRGPRGASSLPR